ncbi:MAG: hypothetical protein ABFC67_14585 [Mizugakiibacter sp.]|uniref:hypothetical protein n=1 Tax=Mizugakiibacter sp. TaxID=1972610 RepID=UPI00321095A5
MSVQKPSLPDTPKDGQARYEFDSRVRETLLVLTGRKSGAIKPLSATASNADIISKINELIARLM